MSVCAYSSCAFSLFCAILVDFLFACFLCKAIEKEGMHLLYGWEGGEDLEERKEVVS